MGIPNASTNDVNSGQCPPENRTMQTPDSIWLTFVRMALQLVSENVEFTLKINILLFDVNDSGEMSKIITQMSSGKMDPSSLTELMVSLFRNFAGNISCKAGNLTLKSVRCINATEYAYTNRIEFILSRTYNATDSKSSMVLHSSNILIKFTEHWICFSLNSEN